MSCPGVLCRQPALPPCPAPLPQPRPLAALVQAWLAMAVLAPLNWLCQLLVAAKVRTALGVKACVVSGGGSLATHLDEFYEVRTTGLGCAVWIGLLCCGLACCCGARLCSCAPLVPTRLPAFPPALATVHWPARDQRLGAHRDVPSASLPPQRPAAERPRQRWCAALPGCLISRCMQLACFKLLCMCFHALHPLPTLIPCRLAHPRHAAAGG